MSNIDKTIEELSITRTGNDLWDEITQDTNPNLKLLYINESFIPFRFVGPFMSVYRYYAPAIKDIPEINVEAIADHNMPAIDEAIKIIRAKPGDRSKPLQVLDSAKKGQMTWQKCIMSNVYVRMARHIRVVTLTRKMIDAIANKMHRAAASHPNLPLSGLYAYDIGMSKSGNGMATKFDANVIAPNYLPIVDINNILMNGLIDIPTLISELNKCKSSHYYYKRFTDYKMPSEYAKFFLEENARREEGEDLRRVENHLHELPPDAFERRNNMRGAIGSLEV